MLDSKNRALLSLLSENSYITAQEIGSRLSLSEKTVRTRLHEIMDAAEQNGAKIISKPRYGYGLQILDAEKWSAFFCQRQKTVVQIPKDAEERVEYILAALLTQKAYAYIKLEQLSETLYVSSKTLTGEIKRVEYILHQFSLSLDRRPHYGIRIEGSEFNKRCCILQNFYMNSSPFWPTEEKEEQARQMAPVLLRLIRQFHIRFTETTFQKTIYYIQISLARMQSGFAITNEPPEYVADITAECDVSREVYREFAPAGHDVPSAEVLYTGIYIAGKRIMGVGREMGGDLVTSSKLDELITRMFEVVYQTYGVDFREDLNLRILLLQHLKPMEIRLRYDIPVEMCADEIKEKYFFCYTMAQLAAKVLEEEFGKPLPEEELLCLSIYFALAMDERHIEQKKKNNILLICVSGKASAQLLVYRFKKEFGEYIQSLNVCSLYDLEHIDLSHIDLIFSTVPVYKPVPVPIMQIRDFFEGQDILSVRRFMESGNMDLLDRYFREELFFADVPGTTREEVLHEICRRMGERVPLPEGFEEAVFQRERMGSTDFGNLCAIPHPCRLMTDESFAAVAVLQHPIHWERNPVQVVVLVSLKNESGADNQEFYRITAEFLSDEAAVKRLIEEPGFRTFRNILTGLKR